MRTVAPPGNLTDARQRRNPRIQGAAAQGLARPFASRVRVACAVAVLLALTVLAAGFSLAVGSRSIPLVLALGDDAAVGLGAKPGLVRLASSVAAVVFCGATTAIAGPIAFVGLMVPHLVNLLYKGNLRMQMLLTALLGAFVLTAADVLGRVAVSPGELEVGIVTAFVGAPVFIAVAVRSAAAMRTGEVA